jgi:hypothetical protein
MADTPVTPVYSPVISAKKGGAGAIDGTIASVITFLVIWSFKSKQIPIPDGMETIIGSIVGVFVSAMVIAAKRFIGNWLKNHNIAVPAELTEQPPTTTIESK